MSEKLYWDILGSILIDNIYLDITKHFIIVRTGRQNPTLQILDQIPSDVTTS